VGRRRGVAEDLIVEDIDVAPSAPQDPPASAGTEPDVAPVPGDGPVPDTVAAPRTSDPFPTFRLGNLRLAAITLAEAVAWILDQSRKERSCVVVTSNVFHLMLAERDAEFAHVAASCELNVADGWPLVAASRLLRTPAPERIAGVDLVDSLLCAPVRLRVAILGGAPGVADLLADRFRHAHDVVFVDPLPMGEWQADEYQVNMRSTIAEARPNLVLIGIGAPRQELLSDSLRGVVCGPIIGCGQTVDVLGGVRPRAPRFLQAVGMEWAFRMAMEPRRLGSRYLVAGAGFVAVVTRELRRNHRPRMRHLDGG
jgi:N-acetylglucosaminyldiphosphoundecaprenol N-acetyl-beta-D-mannosaminyltransferase